jgi:hypothetical protein
MNANMKGNERAGILAEKSVSSICYAMVHADVLHALRATERVDDSHKDGEPLLWQLRDGHFKT